MDPEERALAILEMDSEKAAERLDALPQNERVDLVLSLPSGKKRMDLILTSSRPEELARAIPPEDFVLSIKDIGDADAVVFLELSSDRQLNYLFDLELWIREGLDLNLLAHWLEILFECGEPRMLRWLHSVDFELLVLLFERTALLLQREEMENLPDRLSGRVYTPDNTHFFLIKLGADYHLLKKLMDLLYAKSPDLFFALTGNLGTTPLSEVEELAYRWRTGRLADRGWPDLDEALAMYQPAEPEQIRPRDVLPFGTTNPPRYPLQPRYAGKLLAMGIAKLQGDSRDLVASQLANLINRAIISDSMVPGDAESLKRASERVRGRLEIGLSLLGAGDADAAARLLESLPLLDVFRVAQGAIIKRAQRARKIMSKKAAGLLDLFPAPLPDCLKALLAKRPLFISLYESLPREFQEPADLAMLDRDLDSVEAAFVLGDALGLSRSVIRDPFPQGTYPESPEGLTFFTLLLTGFARRKMELETQPEPFPVELLPELFDRLPRERDSLYRDIHDWAGTLVDSPPPGLDRLAAGLAQLAWQEILVHEPDKLDPRFVEGLWLKR